MTQLAKNTFYDWTVSNIYNVDAVRHMLTLAEPTYPVNSKFIRMDTTFNPNAIA